MTTALTIFPRERIDFGRLGLPVAHLSRDQRYLLELLVTLYQQDRARQKTKYLAAELKCSQRHVVALLGELQRLGEITIQRTPGDQSSYLPGPDKAQHWRAYPDDVGNSSLRLTSTSRDDSGFEPDEAGSGAAHDALRLRKPIVGPCGYPVANAYEVAHAVRDPHAPFARPPRARRSP